MQDNNNGNNKHPIEAFMSLTMENLQKMVDVDTIVGNPIDAPDGSLIIPLSKVKFGFAAGGSEFMGGQNQQQDQGSSDSNQNSDQSEMIIPFGGGSGGGVSITPYAFLIANKQGVELITLNDSTRLYEKLLDKGPQVIDQVMEMIKQGKDDNSK
ncbi:GerW family sporulation protein [Gracilibacillus sp. YIM 98692]|uniref:GerW family sporulation protein n=1 Tax=Gracilibacillus sp. YIM 98692 TaxID=2663532 RepID=UPI0013D5167E|nr:GerW family sporulation protein [Gracilibacillus sp. YIM 98692]